MKEGKALKRILIILSFILLFSSNVVLAEESTEQKQILVEGNEKEGVYLYATPNPKEELLTDFEVKIGKEIFETYGWNAPMREERKPELHVVDLNKDGQKEIVVIITIGTGTWVVQKEAHIIQQVETIDGKVYEEMDIENPVHTIELDFKITATDKTIQVKGRGHIWKAVNSCGKTYYRHRFPFYQSVNWKVEANQLVANVGLTLTHNCVPAGFVIKYKQKGEIYVAKKVDVNL